MAGLYNKLGKSESKLECKYVDFNIKVPNNSEVIRGYSQSLDPGSVFVQDKYGQIYFQNTWTGEEIFLALTVALELNLYHYAN